MADENKGDKGERLFEPEVEGSLEKFEEELLREEKRRTLTNLLAGLVIVVVISGGSYLIYLKYIKPQFMLFPETHTVASQKAVPKSSEEPVKQLQVVAKPEVKPEVKTAAKPDIEPTVKAGIKEEILKEAPKAMEAERKASSKKTVKAEKPPLEKSLKTKKPAISPRKPDSVKTAPKVASVKEKTAPQRKPAVSDKKLFTMQIGFFRERANAGRLKRKLEKLNLTPTLRNTARRAKIITVYSGEYPFREFATRAASNLLKQGFRPEVVITGPGRYELKMGRFESEALADGFVKSLEAIQLKVRVGEKIEKVRAAVVLLKDIRGKDNLKRVQELLRKEKIKFILVRH